MLYLRGSLPLIEGRGGDGPAAGIFDGIDIDWEWPATDSGLEGNSVERDNDAGNLRLLLQEFRTQLDAWGGRTGHSYSLSAFLPANPKDIEAGGWNDPRLFDYLDAGISPAQLGLGLAAFGRGWAGAATHKLWGAATGPAPSRAEPGLEDYDWLRGVGREFTDEKLGAAWRFDGDS